MILLDQLMAFLDDTMGDAEAAARIDPYMANGLQVRGREEVHTIVSGVSASLRFFEEAVTLGASAVVGARLEVVIRKGDVLALATGTAVATG